jgi:hypothetical protein
MQLKFFPESSEKKPRDPADDLRSEKQGISAQRRQTVKQ